jgi:uncharacterized protein (DUF2147 family)
MSDPRMWGVGLAAVVAALASGAYAAGDPVLGDWLTASGGARVRIAACAASPAQVCGTVTWLKDAKGADGQPVRDGNNPDAALRARPVLGIQLIADFRRESPGHWVEGRIYDPNSGKTYRSKINTDPDGKLKVSGCVLMICQTQTWTRAN